ncbi:alpha/beta fold hydrolase [bacterium]|nr:MAG: alpha/beta fold hydrolase [bacterium]
MKVREGHLGFRGHAIWYQVVGESTPGRWPLLTLHGGPGAAHDCIEPLGELAGGGRDVVFYDQLGCGRSDQPHDPSLWTIELFLEELDTVRAALGLERIHLFGLSWGGMLAMEYALRRPAGLESLILASAPASMASWVSEADRLRRMLPAEVQETLLRHESEGSTDSPEYQQAMLAFYERHVCRRKPWPDPVRQSVAQLMSNPEVYLTMNGPSEFHVTGTLRSWSVAERLGEIRVPTLFTCGRHDECTPEMAAAIVRQIPGAELVVFEASAHFAHAEEPERYRQVAAGFLDRVEAAG